MSDHQQMLDKKNLSVKILFHKSWSWSAHSIAASIQSLGARWKENTYHLSNEKRAPGCLVYIGDYTSRAARGGAGSFKR